jgi:diguanylate cyclase (GGDEF)-like protein
MILPDTTPDGAKRRAEDTRAAVKRLELNYHGKPIGGLTVSLGLALFPYHADQATPLLRKADEALYQAKSAGRDRVAVSDAAVAPLSEAAPKSRTSPAS